MQIRVGGSWNLAIADNVAADCLEVHSMATGQHGKMHKLPKAVFHIYSNLIKVQDFKEDTV